MKSDDIDVSIIMSVKNALPYLKFAVESILQQTFTKFEFIILDNDSSDGSIDYISQLEDNRIIFLKNKIDLGLSASLNKGLSIAKGSFIARMDADDIALPDRIQKQVAFLLNNPKIQLCGSNYLVVDQDNNLLKRKEMPCNYTEIRNKIFFGVPFAHPCVMYRANFLKKNNLSYDESLVLTQDYMMWITYCLELECDLGNIQEYLLRYRLHDTNETLVKNALLIKENFQCYRKVLSTLFKSEIEKEKYYNVDKFTEFHMKVNRFYKVNSISDLTSCGKYILLLNNTYMFKYGRQGSKNFETLLLERWANVSVDDCVNRLMAAFVILWFGANINSIVFLKLFCKRVLFVFKRMLKNLKVRH